MFAPGDFASKPIDPLKPRRKGNYIGAPAVFALEMACQQICEAYTSGQHYAGLYLVGSCLERPNWRDVDVRLIMDDAQFTRDFPDAGPVDHGRWEFDPKWLLLTISISAHLSKLTGLPIDFQFQPQSHANARHHGRRNALGMHFAKGT